MDHNKIPGQADGDSVAQSGSAPGATASSDPWMKLAQDAYQRSTTYGENNYRKQIEDGLRLFNSQHPRDSKYNSDAYKYRSRVFRPKTRSVIRKHEATAAMALFSNPDMLSVDPLNEMDDEQIISAQVNKELLQYRLTRGSKVGIPWFILSIGAFQDAMTVGICASFNYWDYQTRRETVEREVEFMGQSLSIQMENEVPTVDKPVCELVPIDNIRFDPAAKWYDVAGTSPYLILQLPMYLTDVLDRMEADEAEEKGDIAWKSLPEKTILQARITEQSSIQQARDGRREDPQKVTSTVNEFDTVMVHLNFIKKDGETWVYYTLKDLHLLSKPRPLAEVFLHGEIPVTIGFCVVEAHKALPSSLANLGSQLQQEVNEVANQRLDNVKFVLNKRWKVRRGSQVDTEGLLRNVPGGISMVTDVEKDMQPVEMNDVTGSSFQEQDRLNADFDDIAGGGLNSSSVMTNRRMNETVGGMRIMAQGANALTEYTLRVWVETWVEPTLRQLIKLEQYYESDETVLAIAAQRAGAYQRFGRGANLDRLLQQELTVSVNVGMGATDPEARLQKFMQAMGAYTQVVQASQTMTDMNLPEVRKELFGLAGFKDSKRFFQPQADPRVAQAQQMLQQAEGVAMRIIDQHKDRIQRRERALDQREQQIQMESKELEGDLQLEARRLQAELQMKWQEAQQKFALDKQEANNDLKLAWFKAQQEAAIRKFEATVKARIDIAVGKAKTEAAAKMPKAANGSE